MSTVLIAYYSRSGNTEKMAKRIDEVIKKEGVSTDLKKVTDVKPKDLLEYDGIIMGSPTYYGSMAWEVKKLFDESIACHGKLKGKIGGAFTSANNVGGGNETAILDMLNAMIVHGMIVQGEPLGDHYGPVGIGAPDERALKCCERLGKNIANLVKKLT